MKEMKTGVSFTPVSTYLPIFLQIIRNQHPAFKLNGNQLANRNDLVMQFFFSDFRTLGPAGTAFFETPQNYTPPQGGESLDSVLRRTGGFLDALQQLPEDRHVLVASHGAALNALYLQIKGLPLSLFWTHRFGNCSIVRLGLSGGRLSVLEEYPEPVAPA